ncbi:MAG: neutral zinc metallopeptidase, partial [Gemmatimonadota bacterium]|nr:neutral zinc metallopeptidase [Gemmatimonadota bacterium]
MRWRGRRQSTRVEDRRGRRPAMVRRGAPIGCGGLAVLAALIFFMGRDPQQLIEIVEQAQQQQGGSVTLPETYGPGGT